MKQHGSCMHSTPTMFLISKSIFSIDVSYNGTWMKIGHTSKVGTRVIVEIMSGFVTDFQDLSKFCQACTSKESEL